MVPPQESLPMKTTSILFTALLALSSGCAPELAPSDVDCSGDKCDEPGGTATAECLAMFPGDRTAQKDCREERALDHCALRRADSIEGSQLAFTDDAIRWAAADVEGVTNNEGDSRGLEYVEYFAMVSPPPETEGGESGTVVALGQNLNRNSTTPSNIELTEDQIFALEDEPSALAGQCVFTAWHSDVDEPLPACNGSEAGCPNMAWPEGSELASWVGTDAGYVMNAKNLQMKSSLNSNGAASDLVRDCMTNPLVADEGDASDPLHDDYTRGCMKAFSLFQTEWRRSDSAICVAGGRLSECGCGIDTNADGIADITDPSSIALALIPRQPVDNEINLRGFPLGTWSGADALPAGCHFADTGDDSQIVVTCDLTANDILAGAADVKERCRSKYGNNVVVHVPVPSEQVVCEPPTDGPHAASCGAFPWIVSP